MDDLFAGSLSVQPKPIPPLTVTDIVPIGDNGFIPDWRLANVLGFQNERRIRSLIDGHTADLERFGKLNRSSSVLGQRGPAADVYLLNRKQALFVTAKSRTPNATEILILIVEVFDAWLSGRLRPVDSGTSYAIAVAAESAQLELLHSIAEEQRRHGTMLGRIDNHTTQTMADVWQRNKEEQSGRTVPTPEPPTSSGRPRLVEPRTSLPPTGTGS